MPPSTEEKLDNLTRLTERLLIKLFGEVEGETPTGRLLMLETRQGEHDQRIRNLEKLAFKIGGAVALVGTLAGLLEAASHFASAVKH